MDCDQVPKGKFNCFILFYIFGQLIMVIIAGDTFKNVVKVMIKTKIIFKLQI